VSPRRLALEDVGHKLDDRLGGVLEEVDDVPHQAGSLRGLGDDEEQDESDTGQASNLSDVHLKKPPYGSCGWDKQTIPYWHYLH